MNINELKRMGLVSPNPLVKRDIKVKYRPLKPKEEWADPQSEERQEEEVEGTVEVWIRKMTAADQIAVGQAIRAGRDPIFTMLHRSVYDEEGVRVFETEEDACGIDLMMFAGLVNEINKINEGAGKKSQARRKPSASLPSPSVDAASQSGKNP